MTRLPAFALLLLAVFLSGCSFDQPLTDKPSSDINTWLLGVWEYKDEKGRTYRAAVMPLTDDRYTVWFRHLGKKKSETKEWQFEAWPSRVGDSTFLTLRCDQSDGDVPVGGHVFVHTQVLDQRQVIVRPLQIDAGPESTSYEIRRDVRRKLKERSLLPQQGSTWTRIAEVYWRPGNEGEGSFTPVRFPEF
jgi:hypothetical protein